MASSKPGAIQVAITMLSSLPRGSDKSLYCVHQLGDIALERPVQRWR
jgi:hypothetical protein